MSPPPVPSPAPSLVGPAEIDTLAIKGAMITDADPLSLVLRSQQAAGAGQYGFDVGMAAAEKDTAPGPGKQHIRDSLPMDQQAGFDAAVMYSLERPAPSLSTTIYLVEPSLVT